MISDSSHPDLSATADLAHLRLLHLADSALPIGALAHSFGLESLVAAEVLQVRDLADFLRCYLEESGFVDAVFCRAAASLAHPPAENFSAQRWLELNHLLSALKPAREGRAGSASLGRNFLQTVLALGDFRILRSAISASNAPVANPIHHAPAFGLASGALAFNVEDSVLAYLHQVTAGLVSACQRLLPLGQTEAARILWNLKPVMIETAARSAACAPDDVFCFMPLLDWGAMEHPALTTRLFVS